MIKMTIHNGEQVQQRDIPCDFLSLRLLLYQADVMRRPDEISVQDVNATFESSDPLGQKIIGLIRPDDLLSDIDSAVHQIKCAPPAIHDALAQALMDNALENITDISIWHDHFLKEACRVRQASYFPLTCSWEDEDGERYESDAFHLTEFEAEIREALNANQALDSGTMAFYFWCHDPQLNAEIKNKLLTAIWNVEEIKGQLYGRVDVTLTGPFTPEEQAAMKEWITGQNSDGLGEGFEQRPIETRYGNIYVSFWHAGNDYYIASPDELDAYLAPFSQTWDEMQM